MSGSRRGASLLLAVVVLLGVVAIAAAGDTPTGTGGSRRPSDWLLDLVVSLLLVQLAIGAVLLAVLLVLRPQELVDPRQEGRATGGRKALVGIAIVLALLVFFAVRRLVTGKDGVLPGFFGNGSTGSPIDSAGDRYEPHFATWPVAAITALLLVAVAAWLLARRSRRRPPALDRSLRAALEAALDDSLDDLAAEPDPRRAVIAAYARLEQVLAAHDVPRLPAEAPEEYLDRVLSSLEVSPPAVSRLTDLFQAAKFSHHDVDETMKHDAIDALTATRDELRMLREHAEAERRAAFERAAAAGGPT